MIAQASLFGARADKRRPSQRTIQALHLRPVADVVDPEHGADEIPPTPGQDQTGTIYIVGVEREVWTRLETGGTRAADGRTLGPKEAFKEMHRRGARIMRLERSFLPSLSRSSINGRLIEDWHLTRSTLTAESGPAPSSCPPLSAAWTGRHEHPIHDALRLPWWSSSVATEPEPA